MNVYSEQLRPRVRDQLALPADTMKTLQEILEESNRATFPHLLLEGPPGTGKTSTARVLAKQLLGELSIFNFLQLNASAQRGVDTVRDHIRSFTSNKSFLSENCPFKIVFLDQADELTLQAQTALRNLMQTYASNARFILSCNRVSSIIKPIQSRCLTLTYGPVSDAEQERVIKLISQRRRIWLCPIALKRAIASSKGDMRRTCNYLSQSGAVESSYSAADLLDELSDEGLQDRLSAYRSCIEKEYSTIIEEFLRRALSSRMTALEKLNLATEIARAEQAIAEGASPFVQTVPLILRIRSLSYA